MSIALKQQNQTSHFNRGTATATWGSNTTSGNLYVIVVGYYDNGHGAGQITSVTDSQSNTWSKAIASADNNNCCVEIWYCQNGTGGTTPTVTVHVTTYADGLMYLREYSGIVATSAKDVSVSASVSSPSLSTGASSSTSTTNEVVIVGASMNDTAQTFTVGSGYGNLVQGKLSGTSVPNTACEDKIISSTGAQTGTMTIGGSISGSIALATFAGTSSGGGGGNDSWVL